jgi:hypothetical protein
LWKIEFSNELATYTDNSVKLQHVRSNTFLGMYYCYYYNNAYIRDYYKSPSTNHTEGNKLKDILLYFIKSLIKVILMFIFSKLL